MSYCNHCGEVQDESNSFCTNCGEANEGLSSPIPILNQSSTISVENIKQFVLEKSKRPYFMEAVGVILVSVIAYMYLAGFFGYSVSSSGWDILEWLGFYLVLCPLSFGAMVVLIAGPVPPKWLASFENWLDYRSAKAAASDGHFNNFVVSPSLWAYEKLNTSTDKVVDDTLRIGAKAATYIFTVCLFLFLLFVAIEIVIIIIAIAITFAIISELLRESNSSSSSSSSSSYSSSTSYSNESDIVTHSAVKGSRIYTGSNWFNEELAGRVDDDGNIYKGTNWFNEEIIGQIDEDGNIYKGSNFLNKELVGRIDEDGNIHKGTNWFNEEKTGRVDKDGSVYEGTNWLNEKKVGRVD